MELFIQLRDAEANLPPVVDEAMRGQPAVITGRGEPQAVILDFKEWQRPPPVPSFGRLLMAAPASQDDLPACSSLHQAISL